MPSDARWDVSVDARVGGRDARSDAGFRLDVAFRSDASRLVLFGPSGAGKSLTLRFIAGLMRPDRGFVRVDGDTLFDSAAGIDVPTRARSLGYLFQDYALFPHLTVRQNVAFGLAHGWRNPSRRVDDPRVREWLTTLEIDDLADRFPERLSGGQRQRTALARALIAEPRALLLDEPFAALDDALRRRLRSELASLQQRLALPMLLITHDVADLDQFGEAVITIDRGRVTTS